MTEKIFSYTNRNRWEIIRLINFPINLENTTDDHHHRIIKLICHSEALQIKSICQAVNSQRELYKNSKKKNQILFNKTCILFLIFSVSFFFFLVIKFTFFNRHLLAINYISIVQILFVHNKSRLVK